MKTITIMCRLSFIIAIIICSLGNSYGQVTGNAMLNGQTDHSGIKVKFIPHSPTARLDSTLTALNGNYSINLAGGLYQVLFSKPGYQNTYLNSGNSFAIATTATLSNITLQPGNTVIVSGNVSGNWTAGNIYVVNGNIIIPSNTTLTIAPGTIIKFNGNYSILANGVLTANGTSTAPIVFTSNLATPAAGNWDKIEIKNSSSVLNHCLIEYCNTGLYIYNYNATVTNNEIRYCSDSGILAIGGSSLISGNTIHDYYLSGIFGGGTSSTSTISCNTIYNGTRYGIITNSSNIVRNNIIYNINGTPAAGISVHAPGNPIIENNFINNCRIGINIGQNVTPIPNPLIVNNTITNSSAAGVYLNEFYANARIINNIIANNGHGIRQAPAGCSICTTTPDVVANNLLWNNPDGNFTTVLKTGIGQIVTNNTNGHAIDSYYNLALDPSFANNTPPVLNANSPAKNAGDPTYSVNIGYAGSSNCQQLALSVPESKTVDSQVKAFPNPFSESFRVSFSIPFATQVTVELFDLTGRSQGTILNDFRPQGEYEVVYKAEKLKPGMYLLKLTTSNSKTVHRTIIKQ